MKALPLKSVLTILLLLCFWFEPNHAYAQYERPREVNNTGGKTANTFLSFGSGLKHKYGLIGLGVGMKLGENVLGELNLGLGVYGFKTGITAVFNAGSNKKWRPTLGLSRVSGLEEVEMEVEVVHNLIIYKTTTKLDLPEAIVLTPGFQRVFMFRNGSNLALDFGIAIGLNNFDPRFSDQSVLINGIVTPASEVELTKIQKQAIRFAGPTGLSFGLSYNFGLGLK